jgi:hypothetical protein
MKVIAKKLRDLLRRLFGRSRETATLTTIPEDAARWLDPAPDLFGVIEAAMMRVMKADLDSAGVVVEWRVGESETLAMMACHAKARARGIAGVRSAEKLMDDVFAEVKAQIDRENPGELRRRAIQAIRASRLGNPLSRPKGKAA